MKKLISLLLVIIFLFTACNKEESETISPQEVEITENPPVSDSELNTSEAPATTTSQKPGNLLMHGFIAYSDNWIYYNSNGLYKIREDGTEQTKINNRDAENINVAGDYIYFNEFNYDPRGISIYRINTDGTDETLIYSELYSNMANMTVIGDWIYYARISLPPFDDEDFEYDDNNAIHRIRTDGTELQQLNDTRSQAMCVVGDYIYYIGYTDWVNEEYINENFIYKMSLDGNEIIRLDAGEKDHNNENRISDLLVDGEWIYYTTGVNYNKLYKIKTDGTGNTLIHDGEELFVRPLNTYDNWLYFYEAPPMYMGRIQRINSAGDTELILSDFDYNYIAVGGDKLYYYSNIGERELSAMMPNGAEKKNMYEIDRSPFRLLRYETADEGYIYFGDESKWSSHYIYDDIGRYFYGTWSGYNYGDNEVLIIDDSIKTNIYDTGYAPCGYYAVMNTLIYMQKDNAGNYQIYWLDTKKSDTMYFYSNVFKTEREEEEWVFGLHYDDHWFRELTKTDLPRNKAEDGYLSHMELNMLSSWHDINWDLLCNYNEGIYYRGEYRFLPMYLVSKNDDETEIILKVEMTPMMSENVTATVTFNKIDGEWVRTVEIK